MSEELGLLLELLDQTAAEFKFRLTLHNLSSVRLLLPYPGVFDLSFGSTSTTQEAPWMCRSFVTSDWGGLTLQPNTTTSIEFRVHPCRFGTPDKDDRYCIELPPGEYLVWYRLQVNEDYFCPNSHYRYANLLEEAKAMGAKVWCGDLKSNRLNLVRAR